MPPSHWAAWRDLSGGLMQSPNICRLCAACRPPLSKLLLLSSNGWCGDSLSPYHLALGVARAAPPASMDRSPPPLP